jgi:hypothetical protein
VRFWASWLAPPIDRAGPFLEPPRAVDPARGRVVAGPDAGRQGVQAPNRRASRSPAPAVVLRSRSCGRPARSLGGGQVHRRRIESAQATPRPRGRFVRAGRLGAGSAASTSASSSARRVEPAPSAVSRVTRTSTRTPGVTSAGEPRATSSATRSPGRTGAPAAGSSSRPSPTSAGVRSAPAARSPCAWSPPPPWEPRRRRPARTGRARGGRRAPRGAAPYRRPRDRG